ncbi:MAG: ThuA domain-containing protein [Chitinivibrionales bacterium]|nr:ThuA domain-containing protein [Chitinivibrionales bacterium]MBD3357178.1 ThuA domain-containing protein [Chitinivibrionales bacterium]
MKRALIVWGGWEGHEPKQCADVFEQSLREWEYEVIVSNSLDSYIDTELMSSLDLIVQNWTLGELTEQQEAALLNAVGGGVGMAGWHGGVGDAFRNNVGYQFMIGGQFVAHPGGIIDYTVNVVKPDDPIMKGIDDFSVHSEQYYMHVDPSNEVLASTTCSGEHEGIDWIKGAVIPAVWKRRYGKGRVFYCSLGHRAKEFDAPEVRTIMRRGLLWATRGGHTR